MQKLDRERERRKGKRRREEKRMSVGPESSSAPVVLGYWAIRGLAQPARLLMQYSGAEYVDKVLSVCSVACPPHSTQRQQRDRER